MPDWECLIAGVTYTFDAMGRQKTVTQGANTHTYTYDPAKLVLDTETIGYGTFSRTITRKHDPALLRPTGLEIATEYAASYGYDFAARLKHIHPAAALPDPATGSDFIITCQTIRRETFGFHAVRNSR